MYTFVEVALNEDFTLKKKSFIFLNRTVRGLH